MVEVATGGTPLSLNPQGAQHTGFLNLARANRFSTYLGWRPHPAPADGEARRERPEFTADLSALTASLIDVPLEVKAGQKLTLKLDCSLNTKRYWTLLAPTAALHEIFVISAPSHLPPGFTGIPEITLVAKRGVKSTDIPLAAVYLMMLS